MKTHLHLYVLSLRGLSVNQAGISVQITPLNLYKKINFNGENK